MPHASVLLTRPKQQSLALQDLLKTHNIDSLITPCLTISPIPYPDHAFQNLESFDAILITSQQTAPFLPRTLRSSKKPILAIGTSTQQSLLNQGFDVFHTAQQDSASLKEWIDSSDLKVQSQNDHLRLLHIGGAEVSKDFRKHIGQAYNVTHIPVYKASAATQIIPKSIKSLKDEQIGFVLFYSPRSARIFENLCVQEELTYTLKQIQALCLAPSVLKSLSRDYWKDVRVAKTPTTSSLLELLLGLKQKGTEQA